MSRRIIDSDEESNQGVQETKTLLELSGNNATLSGNNATLVGARQTIENLFGDSSEDEGGNEREMNVANEREDEGGNEREMNVANDDNLNNDEMNVANDDNLNDLFGEESEQEEEKQEKIAEEGDDENDLFGEEGGDYGEYDHDMELEPVEKPVITVEALLPDSQGPKDNENLFLLKMPNFLNIDSMPFDASKYIESRENEDHEDELILIENTLRWRYSADNMTPESNARIVRWSNGTFSLLIGEELFDVGTMDISERYQFLTTQFPLEGFLKTQARFRKFMSFTPHSTQSHAHRNLIAQLAKRHQKVNKTKQYVAMEDPEKQARDAEKAEMERQKARRKLEAKRQQEMLREGGFADLEERYTSSRPAAYSGQLDEYENDDFIENDDDLDDYANGGRYLEEESEDEQAAADRLMNAKKSSREETAPSEAPKSKRLRIIEDSDSD